VRVAPVRTNIVVGRIEAGRSAPEVVAELDRHGVLASAMDAVTLRLVTHRGVSGEDCRRAAQALAAVLK
jgi:threonine aldolase